MDTALLRRTSFVSALATHGVSTDERLMRLDALDMTNIKRKLMEQEPEGKGWTRDQCDEAERWYKRFLAAIIKYPDAQLVPNLPIDTMWHYHILDTAKYREDCAHVLGYFLDHYPYFGLNGDAEQRDDCFVGTNDIYRAMFGEDCTQMSFGVRKSNGAGCAPPCTAEACTGGGTCTPATVDRHNRNSPLRASGCSGVDCSPGCRGCARTNTVRAASCNHKGSGTGCGQGGGKGK